MKIQAIGIFQNPLYKNNKQNLNNTINPFKQQTGDIISFSAKQYNAETILNPTNHCAYCGCKVYNESQIDDLAMQILSSKGARLEGNVKSVLEKLTDAKHSQELAVAKRMENKDEIDFFNKFLDISSKKSFLKGEEIFKQVYHKEKDEAQELLVANMHPLLKTIDHVTPQREEKENTHSDINLVEACYCCNHDLKKGVSFNEFYAMFPTIKHNMPSEKFEYAARQLIDSSQSQILQRLSAASMLLFLNRLFAQRQEAKNELDSVDYRIKGCKTGIQGAIQKCQDEIAAKTQEKTDLEKKFEELKQDPEYMAMIERVNLQAKLDNANTALEASRVRRHRLNDSLNGIINTPKKHRSKITLSEEEKAKKIEQLRADIASTTAQIEEQENQKFEIEYALTELNEKYPPIEDLQAKKNKADSIINAYSEIERETKLLEERKAYKEEMETKENELKTQIAQLPEFASSFSIESYPEEIQAEYKHYKDLIEALAYIDEHPNGGAIRNIIHASAREPIVKEIESLENNEAVIAYKAYEHKKALISQLEKVKKCINDATGLIHQLEKTIANNRRLTTGTTLEEAKQSSCKLSEVIRRLNEKQKYIKIPQNIARIAAEIDLLNQTIKDLTEQQKKIEDSYTAT